MAVVVRDDRLWRTKYIIFLRIFSRLTLGVFVHVYITYRTLDEHNIRILFFFLPHSAAPARLITQQSAIRCRRRNEVKYVYKTFYSLSPSPSLSLSIRTNNVSALLTADYCAFTGNKSYIPVHIYVFFFLINPVGTHTHTYLGIPLSRHPRAAVALPSGRVSAAAADIV